jgi:benzylsuccinate synthase
MATCSECSYFFPIPEAHIDYEKGKGDCVLQRQDQKGKYVLSKPTFETSAACDEKKAK